MKKILTSFIILYFTTNLLPQSSLGLNGLQGVLDGSFISINSFEQNPSNYSNIKDWIFSLSYGAEFANTTTSNLYQISAGKAFNNHYFSLRYSPGIQKEFIFKSGETVTLGNSESVKLESRFLYKELFGAGYSYKISKQFSAGLSLRFFKEDITQEYLSTVFSDSIYLVPGTEIDNANFWKGDLGIVWLLNRDLSISLSSVNLFILKDKNLNEANNHFSLKNNKALLIGMNYYPLNNFNINFLYETNNSLQAGISKLLNLGKNKIGISLSAFHDKQQKPFFAGINSSVFFISKSFDISLAWYKYLSNRKSTGSYEDFYSNGITNIYNNQFSFDKLLFAVNFKLNTSIEQKVKFIDLTIKQNIYPALADKYLDTPIASAKVINLTDEKQYVKPSVIINGINNDAIQSPVYSIMPFDTTEINFYTIIPDNYSKLNPELSYANFYLNSLNDNSDDELQKAILINGINAWDGNVHNLKYFIKRDLNFSINYSREILANNKSVLDTVIGALADFYKAKIIFNAFVKNLTYISDPRASSEYVQYPSETIKLKGGDCDDLSVCYSSLLESIGIETALVDYKNNPDVKHVNVMFNSKLTPQQANLITENDTKYFLRKNDKGIDEVWIPVETTSLTDFNSAWLIGSQLFQKEAIDKLGLLNGEVEIIDIY